jgi:hypothetical protein
MMKNAAGLALSVFTAVLVCAPALADNQPQSGSLSAAATSASCAIGAGGTFSGGVASEIKLLTTTLTTGPGTNLALDIRPSLSTGLFTQTKMDTSTPDASSDLGIEVCVTVDGSGAGVLPKSCVIYDQRFQQVSSQLFSQIAACFSTVTVTSCTIESDCSFLGTGFTCNNPTGAAGAGKCVSGPDPLCNANLILSSLAAHSFEFVALTSSKKTHTIEASWKLIGAGTSGGNASVLSCVGPGILTVTQVSVDTLTSF